MLGLARHLRYDYRAPPEEFRSRTRLPDVEAGLLDWVLEQDGATVTRLLAYCVACTAKPERCAHTDRLATALALDMAQWW